MPELTNDPDVLGQWVGRQQRLTDHISAETVGRLATTLNHPTWPDRHGTLPPLWHFLFFAELAPTDTLGPDGHPPRGGFLPPVALPRRMWAQSQVTFLEPIPIGVDAERTSTITRVANKDGSSGPLCFVTIRHDLTVDGRTRLVETQDLVYRADPDPNLPTRPPDPAPVESDFGTVIHPDPVLLFRYSALTFNSHRIHYDREYAQRVEGYGDLVVHGPLTATLLAELAATNTPPGQRLGSFSFRGVTPLLASEPFTIAGGYRDGGVDLWAANPTGGLAMTARAEFANEST